MSLQYIPRNMHTVFALLCFVVVIHWLIFPYPSGLLHWHCGNLTIAPVPAKQPWWIWINTSCEFIMNDCITTTKQNTTKPCAYFLGYTVCSVPICLIVFYFCNKTWFDLKALGVISNSSRTEYFLWNTYYTRLESCVLSYCKRDGDRWRPVDVRNIRHQQPRYRHILPGIIRNPQGNASLLWPVLKIYRVSEERILSSL